MRRRHRRGPGAFVHAAEMLIDRQKRNALIGAARLLGPSGAAALAATRVDPGNFRPGRATVLCLTRPHFARDVEQLRRSDRLNWIGVNLILLGEMQRAWSLPEMQQQTVFQRTLADPRCREAWSQMDTFALHVLTRINIKHPLDALLCANIDYWQAEAFRNASARLGIPFLVLSRENLVTTHTEQLLLERYHSFRFAGDAVAVFSEWMRATLLRAGCVREDQIVVTGAPRLDVWANSARSEQIRDLIVLVTFADPNYYAPGAFRATLDRFLATAARCAGTGVRFVIKAKNKEDAGAVLDMCSGAYPNTNVEITSRAPLEDLLCRARLVIGFNSMALFDALFTSASIVAPNILDSRRNREYLMFDPDDALCKKVLRFYGSAEELDDMLETAAGSVSTVVESWAERRALIGRFVHLPDDGSATELVERFVTQRLRKAQSESAALASAT